jgi:ABC-type transporter Mla maintaining outer membrane lipid asymmetry ATPase subunit MlaF
MKFEPLLELRNASVISADYEILHHIDLACPRGQSTVIIGPSGCGKSTLLKTLAMITPLDRGEMLFLGKNISKMSEAEMLAFRKKNGFVFQDAALWDNMTIYQNLALPLQLHNKDMTRQEIEAKVHGWLVKTGLHGQEHLRPAQMSIGERKILSFIRALINEPDVLFMDEPTLSIDKEVAEVIYTRIRELKAGGCTLITVTHDPDLTSWLADYLVILKQGAIIEAGLFDVVKNSRDKYVQTLLSHILNEVTSFNTDLLDLLEEE